MSTTKCLVCKALRSYLPFNMNTVLQLYTCLCDIIKGDISHSKIVSTIAVSLWTIWFGKKQQVTYSNRLILRVMCGINVSNLLICVSGWYRRGSKLDNRTRLM